MNKKERRSYIRISTVLPVEFFLENQAGKRVTPWLQGFTSDIGKGGICLTVNDLWWGFWDKCRQPGNKVFLRIKLPFKENPLFLEAGIRWTDSKKLKKFYQYDIGLEFTGAGKKDPRAIFKFALFKKVTPILVAVVLSFSALVSGGLFWRKTQIIRQNQQLVRSHGDILERNSYLLRALRESKEAEEFFFSRKEELSKQRGDLQQVISDLETDYQEIKQVREKDKEQLKELASLGVRLKQLNQEMDSLARENNFLKERIAEKEKITTEIKEEAEKLRIQEYKLSEQVVGGMYDWISYRQDLDTGLVLSYEGDERMSQVCFTYDQALAIFVFLLFEEEEKAERILDFYLNEIKQGRRIYNGYFTDGSVFEYVRHSGPKPWLGLAVLKHIESTGDDTYLPIARHIAEFLVEMQDEEGGIVGGPEVTWYSTEHNVDVYGFFRLFSRLTGEAEYGERAVKVKNWLARYAYTDHKVPIKRGKGDATIATDTYAWSITSLGPETLYELGMDPEMILEYARQKCKATVNFERPDGRVVEVQGFDFSKARNIGRGGVVSGEWTAQMILAYQIVADYFKGRDSQRYNKYLEKSIFYANELQKMVIVSPSRVGRKDPSLPYASASFADTGHGWRTPRGNRTGSLASTAYFLIAYKGYNPLRLEKLNVSLRREQRRAQR